MTTDQNPSLNSQIENINGEYSIEKYEVIPLLGMVGEVGGLLSEYKKILRDGGLHQQFSKQAKEELGDILWYVSNVATKFGLNLDEIAEDNLKKTESRWYEPTAPKQLYDEKYEDYQKLPRVFSYKFLESLAEDGKKSIKIYDNLSPEKNQDIGDVLKDNTYEDDGYRYHDIMHMAFMAKFGWSPVFRKLIRKQNNKFGKRPPRIDEAEDSGRPQVIEEGIIAAIFTYAENHGFLENSNKVNEVDWQLLKHIEQMTQKLEVKDRTTWEWNQTIICGLRIWKKLKENNGGIVDGNMSKGTLVYRSLK